MQKNEMAVIEITDIGVNGEGIGKHDGYTLFVKDAVIGDKAEVKVMKAKKNYGYARLMRVLEPSADRVEPRCAFARKCGGSRRCLMRDSLHLRSRKYGETWNGLAGLTGNCWIRSWSRSWAWTTPSDTAIRRSFPLGRTGKETL